MTREDSVMSLVFTMVVLVVLVVWGLWMGRDHSIAECQLRLRAVTTVADSVRVLDTHPFCNTALKINPITQK